MTTSPILWQAQKTNEDPLVRASVLYKSLTWYGMMNCPGVFVSCFESDHEVQYNPVAMLTRFDSGGFIPQHTHPGGEEILVLEGSFYRPNWCASTRNLSA